MHAKVGHTLSVYSSSLQLASGFHEFGYALPLGTPSIFVSLIYGDVRCILWLPMSIHPVLDKVFRFYCLCQLFTL